MVFATSERQRPLHRRDNFHIKTYFFHDVTIYTLFSKNVILLIFAGEEPFQVF